VFLDLRLVTCKRGRWRLQARDPKDEQIRIKEREAKRKMKGISLQYTEDDRVFFSDVAGIGDAKVCHQWAGLQRANSPFLRLYIHRVNLTELVCLKTLSCQATEPGCPTSLVCFRVHKFAVWPRLCQKKHRARCWGPMCGACCTTGA